MLAPLDLILVVIYLLAILMVGILAGRKSTREEFLIAGRKLNFFSTATTIFASKIGAGILLTYTALVYLFGLGAFWFFIGIILGYFVFYFFAKKIKKLADSKKYYTLSDFFFGNYGQLAGYLVSLIVFVAKFGWVVVNFTGGAKILSAYTPLSFELSLLSMGLVILIYLIAGGFRAVVRTDIIQSIGILLLSVLMIYLLISSGAALQSSDFDLFSLPIGQIISFFLAGLLFPMASAELWQRVYAVKDEKNLKKGLILASSLYVLIGIILLIVGIIIRTKLTNLEPDTSLVVGLSSLLPVGLAGLAVIVFYSAIMSGADTFLFTSSSTLTQDFLIRRKLLNKEKLLNVMKVTISFLIIIAILISVVIRDVIDTTFLFVALMVSLGFLVFALWIFPKLNKYSIHLSIILSFIGVVILTFIKGISTSLIIYSLVLSFVGLLMGVIYYKLKNYYIPLSAI